MLNKVFLEPDGLSVGGTQLLTTGGGVSIANTLFVGANTVTSNLTVTGTFNYPRANTTLPAFRAYGSVVPSIPSSTFTAIPYNIVEFDTNGCFNPTSQPLYLNGIYTPAWSWAPNVPGYYQINAAVSATSNSTAGSLVYTNIYKQNNIVAQGSSALSSLTNSQPWCGTVLFMNGVSDYVSIYAWQNSGGALAVGSPQNTVSFNGCFLRPA